MNSTYPLHDAVISQDYLSLEALIKTGIDLEQADANGCTALMLAIENHNLEATKRLIKQNAKVNTKNAKGESALAKAIKTKQTEMGKLLVEYGADCTEQLERNNETVLTLAAWYHAFELFELMVIRIKQEQPDRLKRIDSEGRNLLHRAVMDYQLEIVEVLLRQGVNIEATGRNGYRALHYAAHYGRYEDIKLLLRYGADREAKDFNGRTAQEIARLLKQETCIQLLEAEPIIQTQHKPERESSGDTAQKANPQAEEFCKSPVYLSDALWENIKGYVEAGGMGRPRKVNVRGIIESILYKQAMGCDWRSLPKPYARWEIVCNYYYQWRKTGAWDKIEAAIKSMAAA